MRFVFRLYIKFSRDGYFDEAFGFTCHDNSCDIAGNILDQEYEILISIRKSDIWPIEAFYRNYSEYDLFDVIEFLYDNVSKPIDSTSHGWQESCVHWETFSKSEGQREFREEINTILELYINHFILSNAGEILHSPEKGFERIFEADIPSDNEKIKLRVEEAILKFRRHASSINDRRQAVRDLTDVLEYLRPKLKSLITKKDESGDCSADSEIGIDRAGNPFYVRDHRGSERVAQRWPIQERSGCWP